MSRMQDKYNKEVAPALMEKFSYKSTMQIPKLKTTLRQSRLLAEIWLL